MFIVAKEVTPHAYEGLTVYTMDHFELPSGEYLAITLKFIKRGKTCWSSIINLTTFIKLSPTFCPLYIDSAA